MNVREQFHAIMDGAPVDGMPVLEWAYWWDKTLDGWKGEGLPKGLDDRQMQDYFGLAHHKQFWLAHKAEGCPKDASHGSGIITDESDYDAVRPYLLPENAVSRLASQLNALRAPHESGDTLVWYTLDGAFWWPRVLFGIEQHFYSFYDYPELYHHICDELVEWQVRMVDEMAQYVKPDFMTIAEDMSYNHGPMLSKALFDEFLLPYYRRLIPEIKKHGTRVFIDSDGDITSAVPWFIEAGIDGILPLERQSGVDVAKIRDLYPDFLMIGSFDKMCMFHTPADPRGAGAPAANDPQRQIPAGDGSSDAPGHAAGKLPRLCSADERIWRAGLRGLQKVKIAPEAAEIKTLPTERPGPIGNRPGFSAKSRFFYVFPRFCK
mgnify:CR=1 FL=1